MANPQDQMNKYAQGYQQAQSNQPSKPKTCPTCGQSQDNVPDPKKADAEALGKGVNNPITMGQGWENLKSGLGL